ncbi:MAG: DUF2959 family protein [Tepidisphaeraceae bacterium]
MQKTISAVAVMGLAFVVGCQTPGYKEATKTTNSLADVKTELITDKANLRNAVDSLNDLVYRPADDLRPQYTKFADAVTALDKSTESSRVSARNMIADREAYLSKWRADIAMMTDPDLRMRANDRIADTTETFKSLSSKLNDASNAVTPLVGDLKAIKVFVGNDLTANGIKIISDRATNAKNQSIYANGKLDAAIVEVDKVSDTLAPMASTQPTGETK